MRSSKMILWYESGFLAGPAKCFQRRGIRSKYIIVCVLIILEKIKCAVVVEECVLVRLIFIRILRHQGAVRSLQSRRRSSHARMIWNLPSELKLIALGLPLSKKLALTGKPVENVVVIRNERFRNGHRADKRDQPVEFDINVCRIR